MKKSNLTLGSLAAVGTLFAASAMADTSTTSTSDVVPSLLDKIVLSYWAIYYGPSVGNVNGYTLNSATGKLDNGTDNNTGFGSTVQNLDSTLTMGYRITDDLQVRFNYRFIFRPDVALGAAMPYIFRTMDPWVNLVAPSLVKKNGYNFWADIRAYLPVTTSEYMYGALRTTQIQTIDVPKTRLTLGLYSYQRVNALTATGTDSNMENFDLDVSPFASYQLTPTVAATLWTDIIQAEWSQAGDLASPGSLASPGPVSGWGNAPVDVSLGIGWDITSKINLNPTLTFFPATANNVDNYTLGAIVSAKFL